MSEQKLPGKRDTNRFMPCRTHADRRGDQQFFCPISNAQFHPDQVCPVTISNWERCQDIVHGPLDRSKMDRDSS